MSNIMLPEKMISLMDKLTNIADKSDLEEFEIGIGLLSCAMTYFSDDPHPAADILVAFSEQLRIAAISHEIEDIVKGKSNNRS